MGRSGRKGGAEKRQKERTVTVSNVGQHLGRQGSKGAVSTSKERRIGGNVDCNIVMKCGINTRDCRFERGKGEGSRLAMV